MKHPKNLEIQQGWASLAARRWPNTKSRSEDESLSKCRSRLSSTRYIGRFPLRPTLLHTSDQRAMQARPKSYSRRNARSLPITRGNAGPTLRVLILEQHADSAAQIFRIHFPQIHAAHAHGALVGIVKAKQGDWSFCHPRKKGFAAAQSKTRPGTSGLKGSGDSGSDARTSNASGAYSFQPSGGLLPLAIWRVL